MIPGLPLIHVMFLAQVFNGLLLPVILVFVMMLCRGATCSATSTSGRLVLAVGWVITLVVSAMSIALVITYLAP